MRSLDALIPGSKWRRQGLEQEVRKGEWSWAKSWAGLLPQRLPSVGTQVFRVILTFHSNPLVTEDGALEWAPEP